ncbi:MAG TPA: hypothetical protein PK417_15145 [Hyphomonas sp.]|nr:hypothetical protein [Hyphomonas sp.]HRX74325.1 hypothetical protein [Hyphomonas sp.]
MSPQSLADDLAYIRDLAEAGQKAPLLGGRFLAWWGGLTTLAYFLHYAIVRDLFGWPETAFLVLWIGYAAIGLVGSMALQATVSHNKPGAASTGNRVTVRVWKSAGLMLGAYFLGATVRAMTAGSVDAFNWSVPLVLGTYGLAQYVSGWIAGNRTLIRAGQAALAAVVPAVILVGTPEVWTTGAIIAALTVFLPGIILMRNEPSATV